MRAGKLGQLDREPPDPAARAGDEHRLADHEAADLERPERGQPRHRERRGLLERDRRRAARPAARLRPRRAPPRRRRFTRPTTRAPSGGPPSAAGWRTYPATSHPVTVPGSSVSQPPGLAAIEAERLDLDQRLVRPRLGVRHLGQLGERRRTALRRALASAATGYCAPVARVIRLRCWSAGLGRRLSALAATSVRAAPAGRADPPYRSTGCAASARRHRRHGTTRSA